MKLDYRKVFYPLNSQINLFETIQSTSKYKEISWNEQKNQWQVEINFNYKNSKYYFDNELDAIKKRDQFYKKLEILSKNPEISVIPNLQVTHTILNLTLFI